MTSATSNVRISRNAFAILDRLSERMGKSKSGVVEEALRALEEKAFAADVHDAYRRLRADEAAWRDYIAETAVWDGLSGDGLPPADQW